MRPIYNYEFYHAGVKGMKWGHRNSRLGLISRTAVSSVAKIHKGIAGVQQRSANKQKSNAESIRSQQDQMLALKDRKGNNLFKKEEIDKMISTYETKYKNKQSKANTHAQFSKQLMSQLGQLKIKDFKK